MVVAAYVNFPPSLPAYCSSCPRVTSVAESFPLNPPHLSYPLPLLLLLSFSRNRLTPANLSA